jgi:hypothetical protein
MSSVTRRLFISNTTQRTKLSRNSSFRLLVAVPLTAPLASLRHVRRCAWLKDTAGLTILLSRLGAQ